MKIQGTKGLWVVVLGVAAVLSLTTTSHSATIVTFTYTGAGANPNNWADSNNWSSTTGLYPGYRHFTGSTGGTDVAVITNSLVPVFTNMVDDIGGTTMQLNGLTTGTNKVTFTGGIQADRCYDNTVAGNMSIGSGGVEGTTIRAAAGTYGVASCSVAGNVKANDFGSESQAPTITGAPVFDVKNFYIAQSQGSGAYNISSNWSFTNVDANNLTFRSASVSGPYTFTWVSEPNFNGGRPNYYINNGQGDGYGTVNVSSSRLLGNVLWLDGWPGPPLSRCGVMRSSGGVVDLNEIHIGTGNGNAGATWLGLTNASVYIRGTGTVSLAAWDNRSTNNVRFNVSTGTTTYFDPAGVATQYIDTGSKDRNSVLLDPVDWQNNFAFDQVVFGTNDTVILVGDANIEGAGTNALYATRLTGLGGGATLKLNGHNVYLLKRPDNVTFDTAGGGRVYFPKSGTLITIR